MNRLREVRLATGLTQEEFAKPLGVSKTTYNNYETGRREPRSDFWMAVADKYNVTVDYLIGLSDDPRGTKKESPTDTLVLAGDEVSLVKIYRLCTKEDQTVIRWFAARIAGLIDQSAQEQQDDLEQRILQDLTEFLDNIDLPAKTQAKKEA